MENVLLVSGSQSLLRHRLLHQMVEAKEIDGFRIDRVDPIDAKNPGAIATALAGSMFISGQSLSVVTNPHKGDLALYRDHRKDKKPATLLLLHYDGDPKGNTKFGKFAKELGSSHQRFSAPTQWKAPEAAAEFLIREADEQHGKTLSERLAKALVQRAGSDFGVLAFELRKMALLAEGSPSIESSHIMQGMAELVEVNVGLLLDAFRTRNRPGLCNVLHRIRERSAKDPTMMVCRLVGGEAQKWLQAASLQHMPPKAAADELGLNPWYFEKKILPVARMWGLADLTTLIRVLAAGERGVLDGHKSPWIGLCCGLLGAC